MRLLFSLVLSLVIAASLPAQVRLNEAVNSNNIQRDEDGDTPDWFELYNAGNPVNLNGWTVSDDPEEPRKWAFSNVTIEARGYLLVWASDKDRPGAPGGEHPHTNFRLKASGEQLSLYDPTGTLVDRLNVSGISADHSIGIPAGGGEPVIFEEPSPGEENPAIGATAEVEGVVVFSPPGGQLSGDSLWLMGAAAGEMIRYTLDGSVPAQDSPSFEQGIPLTGNTVVRARIFSEGKIPSAVQTESYLDAEAHDLDVVSMVVNPADFFSGEDGIYVLGDGFTGPRPFYGSNIWQDREVPLHLTYYPQDDRGIFKQDLGTRVFGNFSRGFDQRSLAVFARRRYGKGKMDFPFFNDRPYQEFESLVFRNSGHDWNQTMIRDATQTSLLDGSIIDVQAYRPVVVYLNGEYWGIFNLREKVNEDFLASRYGVDPDSVDILATDGIPEEGNGDDYLELTNFVESSDLASPENFARVDAEIDLESFILYYAAQIYMDNRDWPGNNVRFWRRQVEGDKWKYILFDTDFGGALLLPDAANSNTLEFALEDDGPEWPNPAWSTLFFRKLLQNEGFRHRFINQFADEMNSRFLPAVVIDRINENADRIESEIPASFERWGHGQEWALNVEVFRSFYQGRPEPMKNHIRDHFELPAYHQVKVVLEDQMAGYVEINSLEIETSEWQGDYFEEVPIRVKAVAREGYEFSHWLSLERDTTAELFVNLKAAKTFEPIFTEKVLVSTTQPGGSLVTVQEVRFGPNPTGSVARLDFSTDHGTSVSAKLYAANGQPVHTFTDGQLPSGEHRFVADFTRLPAGVYFLRIAEPEGHSAEYTWVKQ